MVRAQIIWGDGLLVVGGMEVVPDTFAGHKWDKQYTQRAYMSTSSNGWRKCIKWIAHTPGAGK